MENQNPIPRATHRSRNYRTREEMYPLVEKWLGGTEPQSEFRDRHSLSKPVFSYWLKKYRSEAGEEEPQGFVALTVRPAVGLEVVFPNGVVVRIAGDTGAGFIRELAGQC